jgi:hypothetical protein
MERVARRHCIGSPTTKPQSNDAEDYFKHLLLAGKRTSAAKRLSRFVVILPALFASGAV